MGIFAGWHIAGAQSLFSSSGMPETANFSATKKHKKRSNPWQFYGGFGLGFSNNGFYIDLQPGVLYHIKPEFQLGANGQLGYQSYRNFNVRTHTYIYGYDLLALYLPWRSLELSVDYQQLFIRYEAGSAVTKWNVPAFYLGMAYRMQNVAIGFRYDLLYKEGRSIYPSAFTPFIRVYF